MTESNTKYLIVHNSMGFGSMVNANMLLSWSKCFTFLLGASSLTILHTIQTNFDINSYKFHISFNKINKFHRATVELSHSAIIT
jgi:orotidine-5'-phosphate decarboxylase